MALPFFFRILLIARGEHAPFENDPFRLLQEAIRTAFNAPLLSRRCCVSFDKAGQTVSQGLVVQYVKRASPAVLTALAVTGQSALLVQVAENSIRLTRIKGNADFCMVAVGL